MSEAVGSACQAAAWQANLVIDQANLDFVRHGQSVALKLDALPACRTRPAARCQPSHRRLRAGAAAKHQLPGAGTAGRPGHLLAGRMRGTA
jgi:hypothetical protein